MDPMWVIWRSSNKIWFEELYLHLFYGYWPFEWWIKMIHNDETIGENMGDTSASVILVSQGKDI